MTAYNSNDRNKPKANRWAYSDKIKNKQYLKNRTIGNRYPQKVWDLGRRYTGYYVSTTSMRPSVIYKWKGS